MYFFTRRIWCARAVQELCVVLSVHLYAFACVNVIADLNVLSQFNYLDSQPWYTEAQDLLTTWSEPRRRKTRAQSPPCVTVGWSQGGCGCISEPAQCQPSQLAPWYAHELNSLLAHCVCVSKIQEIVREQCFELLTAVRCGSRCSFRHGTANFFTPTRARRNADVGIVCIEIRSCRKQKKKVTIVHTW